MRWPSFRQDIAEGTTMSKGSTSAASSRCAVGFVMHPSVRPYLTSGVAVASAGILAAGLVAAPPEASVAQNEVRGVQLIALALPSTAPSAAILEKFVRSYGQTGVPVSPVVVGGADITGAVVTTPRDFVRAVQPIGSPTQAIDATAQSVIDPAIESQPVTNAAVATSLDVSTNPILGTIVVAFFFFVFIPAALVVVYVVSAVNVVLDALGLPIVPIVPDPPFGPTPEVNAATAPTVTADPPLSIPVASQKDMTPLSTGTVHTNPLLNDPVASDRHTTPSSTGTVRSNRQLSDPVAPDTDTPKTSKPLMNVAKDSPNFAPKPRNRDSSSPNSDLVRTPVETIADNATTVEQHPVGGFGKKPKPDAANGEQQPGGDPSSKRSSSQ